MSEIKLRDYQQRSLDLLYEYLFNNAGNPCLDLPTGAGKSHVIAAFCKQVIQSFPGRRIMMLTHVKELIAQNVRVPQQTD